ncbi:hypothetical protein TNCV_415851 [Trichonephila clavipes]|nr:hypothetical protein TNCV_415851 [Trichonephila clavipes]
MRTKKKEDEKEVEQRFMGNESKMISYKQSELSKLQLGDFQKLAGTLANTFRRQSSVCWRKTILEVKPDVCCWDGVEKEVTQNIRMLHRMSLSCNWYLQGLR